MPPAIGIGAKIGPTLTVAVRYLVRPNVHPFCDVELVCPRATDARIDSERVERMDGKCMVV